MTWWRFVLSLWPFAVVGICALPVLYLGGWIIAQKGGEK
jgi:hypothetical protein